MSETNAKRQATGRLTRSLLALFEELRERVPSGRLALAVVLPLLAVASYATSVGVTTVSYQANRGVLTNGYFENSNAPVTGCALPCLTVDAQKSVPATSGSFSLGSGQTAYLWSPQFTPSTPIPSSRFTLDLWASMTPSAPALDGFASGAGTTSATTGTLTTTGTSDVIYVVVSACPSTTTIGTPTSTGITFASRTSATATGGGQNCQALAIGSWYFTRTSSFSGSVSATCTGATDCVIIAFGISGASTSSPFDPNAAIPKTGTGTTASESMTISTSNAEDFILMVDAEDAGVGSAATGNTLITTSASTASPIGSTAEYRVVSAAQTNLAIAMTGNPTEDLWVGIADAVVSSSSVGRSLTVSALTTTSAGVASSTLFSGLGTSPISESPASVSNVFTVSAGTIPASGYLEVTLTAPAGSSFTIKWGAGQPTNFQVDFTYS